VLVALSALLEEAVADSRQPAALVALSALLGSLLFRLFVVLQLSRPQVSIPVEQR
jgi:hypothetical protein